MNQLNGGWGGGRVMVKKHILASMIMVVASLVPAFAQAGGLFLSEFGTEDVALAGAGWAARAQDASTLFKNPAGMSRLEGNQFQGGLQLLSFQGSLALKSLSLAVGAAGIRSA